MARTKAHPSSSNKVSARTAFPMRKAARVHAAFKRPVLGAREWIPILLLPYRLYFTLCYSSQGLREKLGSLTLLRPRPVPTGKLDGNRSRRALETVPWPELRLGLQETRVHSSAAPGEARGALPGMSLPNPQRCTKPQNKQKKTALTAECFREPTGGGGPQIRHGTERAAGQGSRPQWPGVAHLPGRAVCRVLWPIQGLLGWSCPAVAP